MVDLCGWVVAQGTEPRHLDNLGFLCLPVFCPKIQPVVGFALFVIDFYRPSVTMDAVIYAGELTPELANANVLRFADVDTLFF